MTLILVRDMFLCNKRHTIGSRKILTNEIISHISLIFGKFKKIRKPERLIALANIILYTSGLQKYLCVILIMVFKLKSKSKRKAIL